MYLKILILTGIAGGYLTLKLQKPPPIRPDERRFCLFGPQVSAYRWLSCLILSLSLSLIIAINSLLVGLPLVLWMVYPK